MLGRHELAVGWLRIWADLGRAPNVVSIDSGAGLSNATIQQRLVPVRLFYDHLIEESLRESNPVGHGAAYLPYSG